MSRHYTYNQSISKVISVWKGKITGFTRKKKKKVGVSIPTESPFGILPFPVDWDLGNLSF